MWSIRRIIQTTSSKRVKVCRKIHYSPKGNHIIGPTNTWYHYTQKESYDDDDDVSRLNPHQYFSTTTTPTTSSSSAAAATVSSSSLHQIMLQSPRKVAKLEEDLLQVLSKEVKDPIIPNISPQFRSVSFQNLPSSTHITPPYSTNIPDSTQTLDDQMIPTVTVTIRSSTSLLHPAIDELKSNIQQVLTKELSINEEDPLNVQVQLDASTTKPIPWISNNNNVSDVQEYISKIGPGLQNVAHTVAVYSCKGGVGKSTIAVNLAYQYAKMGVRVGILDVDIYGPSLPVLVIPKDPAVRRSSLGSGMVQPIEHEGVKLMSLGYVSPESGVPGSGPNSGAALMRGPMAGRVTTQLLKGTDWGSLDLLLLDLPPGTGDVQMTICQELELSGAVAVTTPSKLAVTDAKKGIDMFQSMGVPTLVAVENMSYFVCEGGGKHYPFGVGIGGESFLSKDVGLKPSNIFQLPISEFTNSSNDDGSPLCLTRPNDAQVELLVFSNLAKALSTELLFLQQQQNNEHVPNNKMRVTLKNEDTNQQQIYEVSSMQLSLNKNNESDKDLILRLFSEHGATQVFISGEQIRLRDPKTGNDLIEPSTTTTSSCGGSNQSVKIHRHQHNREQKFIPIKVEKKGRYGYEVEFADGATIIYSTLSIAIIAGAEVQE